MADCDSVHYWQVVPDCDPGGGMKVPLEDSISSYHPILKEENMARVDSAGLNNVINASSLRLGELAYHEEAREYVIRVYNYEDPEMPRVASLHNGVTWSSKHLSLIRVPKGTVVTLTQE